MNESIPRLVRGIFYTVRAHSTGCFALGPNTRSKEFPKVSKKSVDRCGGCKGIATNHGLKKNQSDRKIDSSFREYGRRRNDDSTSIERVFVWITSIGINRTSNSTIHGPECETRDSVRPYTHTDTITTILI